MSGSSAASPRPSASADRARRPGGRSARVQSAVFSAVGQLVGSGQRDTMTIPEVAEVAGVNPTSIYRRWGSIETLLGEVAVAALTQGEPLPDTGVLDDDLAEWSRIIAADIGRPKRRAYLRAMVFARNDVVEECPCWEIRREQAEEMVGRAAQRGEATPSVRQILDHVIAPLYHHAVFGLALDDTYAETLTADVMRMTESGSASR
ncbi:TetR/AcrR family transcriptional regulator C-terminal ligand-binding domain-containing protein [Gordonia sp. LSe1-13]|uniref:TetR/AcrR family transcriptional regulator C-terminal ligand-binding domain-containing protein n=2 Tax=Gordonia TaxID=2053 RepID=A0ABU7M9Z6_9ACTN|nr:TetR/AcrR family transcriptional regulator C-terminal ligand-binding domain-containing protein [Gordonia sp. LSe1-13]MEE4022104.1 TetR/AcrR family transcriptional regulator C-terminal ligand-binding domain-containing protein [Gordonia sp. PKS22-38]